jgi:N12 class adenine-specific DNA methylase
LLALENWDPKTKQATPTDVFSKPTLRIYTRPTKADNISQALGISLNERGRVDLQRMAELLSKSEPEVAADLVSASLAFRDPVDGWQPRDLYLSGNVRRKLNDARTAAETDEQYKPNVEALEKVQPSDIPLADIEARIGSTWVPASDYAAFAASLFGVSGDHFAVTYSPTQGRFYFDYSKLGKRLDGSPLANQKWGTPRADFADIMQAGSGFARHRHSRSH